MSKPSKKMFEEIVSNIKHIIEEDKLIPGDKIPSERELAERLSVGRSSIREGLRSLELLGIIETRRGEGTFLCDITNHKLIDMLGMFLISEDTAVDDFKETIWALESFCLQSVLEKEWNDEKRIVLMALIERAENDKEKRNQFANFFVQECGNFMMYRIWKVLKKYEKVTDNDNSQFSEELFHQFLQSITSKNIQKSLMHYRALLNGL